MTVKVLHCADFHFDTPFPGLSDVKAAARQEDLKMSFSKAIAAAKKNDIDLMLISGDLFNNNSIMRSTIEFIKRKLDEIPETRVFISPGNHDPVTERSYYSIIEWPKNVYIFGSGSITSVYVEELNTCVYGIGFHANNIKNSLLKGFRVKDENRINIMVMHGTVQATPFFEDIPYNPISLEEIEQSGLDYLAMGHLHSFSGIKKQGCTYWSYSGSTEGRNFGECGEKGFLIGEIGKGMCDLQFQKANEKEYRKYQIDVSDMPLIEELVPKVEKMAGKDSQNILARIELTGRVEMYFREMKPEKVLLDRMADKFYYLEVSDCTEVDYNIEETAVLDRSVKRYYAQKILELMRDADDAEKVRQLKEAFYFGVEALDGKEEF